MIVIMLMAVALVAGLCVLAYTLAVFALPLMIGVEVACWANASGSGPIGAGVVGLVGGAGTYGLLLILFIASRTPILRFVVASIFTAPAAVAGYALMYGLTHDAVPSQVWRMIFCLVSGGVTGLSALMRLFATDRSIPSRG